MDRPEGADLKELCGAYLGPNGDPAHSKTLERVITALPKSA